MSRNPFLESLDRDNDEAGVRARLASPHGYQDSYKPLVKEWLREQGAKRDAASSAKRDAREEETLAIAKEANDIARSASFAASAAAASASEANTLSRSNSRRIWRSEIIAVIAAAAAIASAIIAAMALK